MAVVFKRQINSQISIRDFVILESCDFYVYSFVILVIFSDFLCNFSAICDFCSFCMRLFYDFCDFCI